MQRIVLFAILGLLVTTAAVHPQPYDRMTVVFHRRKTFRRRLKIRRRPA